MGLWGTFFFSQTISQLEDFKKTLTDAEEIKKVDEAIALLKKNNEE